MGPKRHLLSFGPYPCHSLSLSCKLAIKKDKWNVKESVPNTTYGPNNGNSSIGPIFVVAACGGSQNSGKAPRLTFQVREGTGNMWAGKTPLRLAFRVRKGCGGGSGVGRGCCLYKKDLKKWWISKKPRRNKKKNARFERGCQAGDVAVKEKSWSNVEVQNCSKVLFKLRITWLICHLFFSLYKYYIQVIYTRLHHDVLNGKQQQGHHHHTHHHLQHSEKRTGSLIWAQTMPEDVSFGS